MGIILAPGMSPNLGRASADVINMGDHEEEDYSGSPL